MSLLTLVTRVHNVDRRRFQSMLDSVHTQSFADWELVVLVGQSHHEDRAAVADMLSAFPQGRIEVRPDRELAPWAVNLLIESMGDWIGFIGQHDWLKPGALAAVATTTYLPGIQVIYSDEERRNHYGHLSMPWRKGAFDQVRLRSQEYLQDLTFFRRTALETVGGFNRLASDEPRHDAHLKILEHWGSGGFAHIPEILYQRRRDHDSPEPDRRYQFHMVPYDLWAIGQHYDRLLIPKRVIQLAGTVTVEFAFGRSPSVCVLLTIGDSDISTGLNTLSLLGDRPHYEPARVEVLFTGIDPANADRVRARCAAFKFNLTRVTGDLLPILNQIALRADTELLCFLQGQPLRYDWLARLVGEALMPTYPGAIGCHMITPVRLTAPGVLDYRHEGEDWNTRGDRNHLPVPHRALGVSPHCMLVDLLRFTELGGFRQLPTLYGMDLAMRLDAAGRINVIIPDVEVITRTVVTSEAERAAFEALWPGWVDRYGMHLAS